MSVLARRLLTAVWHWLKDWRSHGLTLLLVLLLAVGINAWQVRQVPKGLAPDFHAPALNLAGTPELSLQQWRAQHPGQAVALHFWADWCPICRMEEDHLSRLQADWPLLSIAMRSGDAPRVADVMRRRGLNWPTVVDTDGTLSARFGLSAVPAFIVLDAKGEIRHASIGYTPELGMRLRLWLAQNF